MFNDAYETGEYVTGVDDNGATVVAWPHGALFPIGSALAGDVSVKRWDVIERDLSNGSKFFRPTSDGHWLRVASVNELR